MFPPIVNMSFVLLVAAAFLTLAPMATSRGVRWFAASFAFGAGKPLSEVLARLTSEPDVANFGSFVSVSLAFHLMAAGLSRYRALKLPRGLLPSSFAISILARIGLVDLSRSAAVYQFPSLLPVVFALILCAVIVARSRPNRWQDGILVAIFGALALDYIARPLVSPVSMWGGGVPNGLPVGYSEIVQSFSAILLVAAALMLILIVVRDMLDAARRRADIDELSGLANRRAFDRDAAELLRRQEEAGSACTVVMFDLDHFKSINDTHGHAAGDEVIRVFARLLGELMRADAVFGRIGGEEFGIMLPDTGPKDAQLAVEDVLARFHNTVFAGSHGLFRATASCGVAVAQAGETLSSTMMRCDRALYRAKAEGRDRFVMAL